MLLTFEFLAGEAGQESYIFRKICLKFQIRTALPRLVRRGRRGTAANCSRLLSFHVISSWYIYNIHTLPSPFRFNADTTLQTHTLVYNTQTNSVLDVF